MTSFLLGFLASPLWSSLAKAQVVFQDQYFGVDFRFETKNEVLLKQAKLAAAELHQKLSVILDPDCRWRPMADGKCALSEEQTLKRKAVDQLAAEVSVETDGVFSVAIRGQKRDYSGLSQGYFIEQLRQRVAGPWLADFSGDVFTGKGFTPKARMGIRDPLAPQLRYAQVVMSEGWMIGAGGRSLGVKLIDGKTGKPAPQSDFEFVVLFAKPEINGARIDAWATAIMIGGRQTLRKLESLKRYQGKWEYLAFLKNGKVETSQNITAQQADANAVSDSLAPGRTLLVPW